MSWVAHLYLLLLSVSVFVALVLVVIGWAYWQHAGARTLSLLGVLLVILCMASGLEPLAATLAGKEFWVNIQYIGYTGIPVVCMVMVLEYIGARRWLTPVTWLAMLLVPVLTQVAIWTNPQHELFRSDLHPSYVEGLVFLGKSYEPLYWFQACYAYGLMALALVVLLRSRIHAKPVYRAQTQALAVGFALPLLWSALYMAGVGHPDMDFTPPITAFSGLLLAYGVLRLRLFSIVPVAHERLIADMRDGVLVLDRDSRVVEMNGMASRLLGLEGAQVMGCPVDQALAGFPDLVQRLQAVDLPPQTEYAVPSEGAPRYLELRVTELTDHQGARRGRLALLLDITDRKQAEAAVQHLAFHDVLTDLPNRELFHRRMGQELSRATRLEGQVAVLLLDLDGFKGINDAHGHHVGDLLLVEVAQRLRQTVRESDTLCRFGGDEFVVLQPDLGQPANAMRLAERLMASLSAPMTLDGHTLRITPSIGISIFPTHGEGADVLLRRADDAMYQAKRDGRARIVLCADDTAGAGVV